MVVLDIATKIIDDSTSIWVVFPGRGRRLLPEFIQNNAVFLESPGAEITRDAANDMKILRQHVRMTTAIQEYQRATDSKTPPSRNAKNYPDAPFEDRRLTVYATNLRKLFGRMKQGDLVIVPGKSIFAPIHFGEVTSDFDPKDSLELGRFQKEKIQFRQVTWLSDSVSRSSIPPTLQIYLSKPPAIAQVPRISDTEKFFGYAYPSYVIAHKSAVMIDAPDYSGKNPNDTIESNELLTYFIAAFNALEQDKIDIFCDLSFDEASKIFFNPDLVVSFTQNFNSPGKYGLLAASAVLSAFVSLGIAVSVNPNGPKYFQNGIDVTNSISPSDKSVAKDAGVKLDYLMRSLGKSAKGSDHLDKIQKFGTDSKKKIGLNSPVKEVKP